MREIFIEPDLTIRLQVEGNGLPAGGRDGRILGHENGLPMWMPAESVVTRDTESVLTTLRDQMVVCTPADDESFSVIAHVKPSAAGASHERVFITGENLLDLVNAFGGVGAVIEKNGMTAVVTDDHCLHVTGTNNSTDWVNFESAVFADTVVLPAGYYSTPVQLGIRARRDSDGTDFGFPSGAHYFSERWHPEKMVYAVAGGASVDVKFPLCIVAGREIPAEPVPYEGYDSGSVFMNGVLPAGSVDIRTGVITRTHHYIDSYAGESVAKGWVSSTGELSAGAKVCVLSETPFVYESVDAPSIPAFPSVAGRRLHIWSRNDEVEVTCRQRMTAGEIADMKAEQERKFDPEAYPEVSCLKLRGDASMMSKDNAVPLEYEMYNALNGGIRRGMAQVRWQGSSSLQWPKKNYSLTLSNPAGELKNGWGAHDSYCAKADYIDFSHLRNVVGAMLWGETVKSRPVRNESLHNLPNGGAIDGFPCIIMLNGRLNGLYSFNIPKAGWMMGMGGGEREVILCADEWVDATGFKGQASLNGDFKVEYVTDKADMGWVLTGLNWLIDACVASDGSDLDDTVGQYLDWDSAVDYFIFTVLTAGWDNTNRNYLLSSFDGVKWFLTAYDMDGIFGMFWDGQLKICPADEPTFESFARMNRIMELILTGRREQLKARYKALRSGALSETNVYRALTACAQAIPASLMQADLKAWPQIRGTAVNNASQIMEFYRLRAAEADQWIENM